MTRTFDEGSRTQVTKEFKKYGMYNAIDGSEDSEIRVQGIETYETGASSDEESDEEDDDSDHDEEEESAVSDSDEDSRAIFIELRMTTVRKKAGNQPVIVKRARVRLKKMKVMSLGVTGIVAIGT